MYHRRWLAQGITKKVVFFKKRVIGLEMGTFHGTRILPPTRAKAGQCGFGPVARWQKIRTPNVSLALCEGFYAACPFNKGVRMVMKWLEMLNRSH
jgi:hypothetical protein